MKFNKEALIQNTITIVLAIFGVMAILEIGLNFATKILVVKIKM